MQAILHEENMLKRKNKDTLQIQEQLVEDEEIPQEGSFNMEVDKTHSNVEVNTTARSAYPARNL